MKKLLMVAMAMGLGSSAFSQSKDLSPTVEKVFSGAFDKIVDSKTKTVKTWVSGTVVKTLGCSVVYLYQTPSKITRKFQCFDPKFNFADYAGTSKLVFLQKKGIVTTYRIGAGRFKGMELRWADPNVSGLLEIQTPGYTSVF